MSSIVIFNNLRAIAFMKRYPVINIQPPAGGPGAFAAIAGSNAPAIGRSVNLTTGAGWAGGGSSTNAQAEVHRHRRIMYFRPIPHPNAANFVTSQNCDGPVRFEISNNVGYISLFHLPYNNDENHRITLDDQQAIGNVNFFLTELVDGCSIYVEGTPQQPTVYHLNAVGTVLNNPVAHLNDQQKERLKWTLRWARMDTRFSTDAAKPPNVAGGDPALLAARKLEDRDYMIRKPLDITLFENSLAQLQQRGLAPTQLNGQSVDRMRLVATQGTVFGTRSPAGIWRFYVQRRAQVEYFHVTVAPIAPTFKQKVKGAIDVVLRRPAAYGPAAVNIQFTLLGEQWLVRDVCEFWPGTTTGRGVV
jgi:hypothetical protein